MPNEKLIITIRSQTDRYKCKPIIINVAKHQRDKQNTDLYMFEPCFILDI